MAYDLHPQYMSTRFALQLALSRQSACSTITLTSPVAWRRTVFAGRSSAWPSTAPVMAPTARFGGGNSWLPTFGASSGARICATFLWPGGDAAVRQPWRMALSYLRDAFGADIPDGLAALNAIPVKEFTVVDAMLRRKFSLVQTSSCGRLFDAVASILGLRQRVNFEGQAAIELECLAGTDDNSYPFEISPSGEVDFRSTIQATVRDFRASQPLDVISARFHNTAWMPSWKRAGEFAQVAA